MVSRNRALLVGAVAAGAVGIALAARRTPAVRRLLDGADWLLHDPTTEYRVVPVVTDDGAHLNVREYGDPDAEPIVLSHGWTCSADFWAPQINALADRYRVIAYDQRGHGSSDLGTRHFGSDVLGDDLAAILEATITSDTKAVLVGHSMGGMSVMAWAGDHPKQVQQYVKAILLADTASDSLIAETTVVPRFPRLPERVAASVLSSGLPIPATPLSSRAVKYVALGRNATPAQVAFCEKIVRECEPKTRGLWGAALSALDIHEALENIDVPTTVIVGTADRLTPPIQSRKLAAALERAGVLDRLVEVPGAGHMVSVEAIDEFNAELVRLAEEN